MLNEITTGMENAAVDINENFQNVVEKEDTGWIKSTALLNGASGTINYRKKNGFVEIYGDFKVQGGGNRVATTLSLFQLPEGFRPNHPTYLLGIPSPTFTGYPENHSAVCLIYAGGSVSVQTATSDMIVFLIDKTYFAN